LNEIAMSALDWAIPGSGGLFYTLVNRYKLVGFPQQSTHKPFGRNNLSPVIK
jgi:hypothetical protein